MAQQTLINDSSGRSLVEMSDDGRAFLAGRCPAPCRPGLDLATELERIETEEHRLSNREFESRKFLDWRMGDMAFHRTKR